MASIEDVAKIFAEIKSLHKDLRKIRQILEDPTGEKAKARSENNGFKKPIKVDAELKEFLGLADGELVSRSAVTKAINVYAEKHGLKKGQYINMDDKLRSLLKPPPDADVTFLQLQKYLAPHYIKDEPVSQATPVVEVSAPKKPRVKKN